MGRKEKKADVLAEQIAMLIAAQTEPLGAAIAATTAAVEAVEVVTTAAAAAAAAAATATIAAVEVAAAAAAGSGSGSDASMTFPVNTCQSFPISYTGDSNEIPLEIGATYRFFGDPKWVIVFGITDPITDTGTHPDIHDDRVIGLIVPGGVLDYVATTTSIFANAPIPNVGGARMYGYLFVVKIAEAP